MSRKKTPEGYVKSAVLDYLAMKNIYTLRVNSGALMGSTNGNKWCVRLAPKGTADILALRNTEKGVLPIWIETKAPKKGPSDDQIRFQREVEGHGHVYMVVTDVNQLIHYIDGIY